MNPLEINKDDIKHLFDVTATNILINNQPTKAIITNSTLSTETEDKHLHTLESINTGDLITFEDEPYLIIKETITKLTANIRH